MGFEIVDWILNAAGTGGIAVVLVILLRMRRRLRATTLTTAWCWLMAGVSLWGMAWCLSVLAPLLAPSLANQIWYLSSVVVLGGMVAVLGARNPGAGVWTWFVLVPLLLVLELPALTSLSGALSESQLLLELPATLGYLLVLVMGTGNYFGTRFTFASLLLAAALVLLAVGMSAAAPEWFPETQESRMWATFLLTASALAASRRQRNHARPPTRFDRLWLDFRDWFGIVWAKRAQDRLNETARNEKWPVRIELHGLVPVRPDTDVPQPGEADGRIEYAFRWQLRRFVEAEWIDERLGNPPA